MDFRVGYGYDVHQLKDGLTFMLGGVEVKHTKGAVGHSDADVLIHAICDALLGAAGLQDIGYHFSDKDHAFKGIDSKILLGRVVGMIHEKGFSIGNVDATVSLQNPKVAPYIDQMKTVLSAVMKIHPDRVSIKATTTEKLGFEGREEGVSAHAVALIKKPD